MKSLLLIGGLLGFGIGAGVSFLQAAPWSSTLWHGCVSAYLTALLARWWGQSWRKNLEEALNAPDEDIGLTLPKVNTPKTSKS